jgi:hypothetical protein
MGKYQASPTSAAEIRRLMKVPAADRRREGIALCDKGLAILKRTDGPQPVVVSSHTAPAKTQKRSQKKGKTGHPKAFNWHEFWQGVKSKK